WGCGVQPAAEPETPGCRHHSPFSGLTHYSARGFTPGHAPTPMFLSPHPFPSPPFPAGFRRLIVWARRLEARAHTTARDPHAINPDSWARATAVAPSRIVRCNQPRECAAVTMLIATRQARAAPSRNTEYATRNTRHATRTASPTARLSRRR